MHEQSETVQRPDGKWINVYGRKTRKAGQQLEGTSAYDSVKEAVAAAKARSAAGSEDDISMSDALRSRPRPKTILNSTGR